MVTRSKLTTQNHKKHCIVIFESWKSRNTLDGIPMTLYRIIPEHYNWEGLTGTRMLERRNTRRRIKGRNSSILWSEHFSIHVLSQGTLLVHNSNQTHTDLMWTNGLSTSYVYRNYSYCPASCQAFTGQESNIWNREPLQGKVLAPGSKNIDTSFATRLSATIVCGRCLCTCICPYKDHCHRHLRGNLKTSKMYTFQSFWLADQCQGLLDFNWYWGCSLLNHLTDLFFQHQVSSI